MIYRILELHGYKVGLMHASLDTEQRIELVYNRFQGRPTEEPNVTEDIDILVGVYRTMGTSWTMIRARQCILFELDYDDSSLAQAEYRIRRIGQKFKSKFIRYHLKDCIDLTLNDGSLLRKFFANKVTNARKLTDVIGSVSDAKYDAKYSSEMASTTVDQGEYSSLESHASVDGIPENEYNPADDNQDYSQLPILPITKENEIKARDDFNKAREETEPAAEKAKKEAKTAAPKTKRKRKTAK